jgi:hypothetical protein
MARANEIQEEIKETRQHIEDAGAAMVEKLELLEQRLRESVEGVKRNFDLHYQADRHPLALFGGSLLIGYLFGAWLGGDSQPRGPSYLRRDNGVRNHVNKEIAATVKGMAAGALTSTLLDAGKRALSRRGEQRHDSRYPVGEGAGHAAKD